MATVTHRVVTTSSSTAFSYASAAFVPTAGDLLIGFALVSACSDPGAMTASANGITFTRIATAASASSVDTVYAFIADQMVPASPSSMTVTIDVDPIAGSGAVVAVASVAGVSNTGLAAIRQFETVDNHASGTPEIVFGSTPLTGNPQLGVIVNSTNPAGLTPPTSWTEAADVGYVNPNKGVEYAYRASGGATATITWGSSSASSWAGILVELVGTTPVSVAAVPIVEPVTIPTPSVTIPASAAPPATAVSVAVPPPDVAAAATVNAPVIEVPVTLPTPGVEGTGFPAITVPVNVPVPTIAANVGVTSHITVPVELPVPTVESVLNVDIVPIVVAPITVPAPGTAAAVNAAIPAVHIPVLIPLPLITAGEVGSWVQPRGDVNRRASIPHATAVAQAWGLAAAYRFYRGRTYPIGMHGDQVTNGWTVTSTWSVDLRDEAEVLLRLLRDVAREADARLDVHIAAPPGGNPIDFTGETHAIPQNLAPGVTTIEVTFTQVAT